MMTQLSKTGLDHFVVVVPLPSPANVWEGELSFMQLPDLPNFK